MLRNPTLVAMLLAALIIAPGAAQAGNLAGAQQAMLALRQQTITCGANAACIASAQSTFQSNMTANGFTQQAAAGFTGAGTHTWQFTAPAAGTYVITVQPIGGSTSGVHAMGLLWGDRTLADQFVISLAAGTNTIQVVLGGIDEPSPWPSVDLWLHR